MIISGYIVGSLIIALPVLSVWVVLLNKQLNEAYDIMERQNRQLHIKTRVIGELYTSKANIHKQLGFGQWKGE